MEKMDGQSKDILADNINKLKELFPEAFSEGQIDFDSLKELLGEFVDNREERYNFTWNGKSQARMIAQTPSTGTLRPCKEESVNWDATQNIFIEGDNLEVLKLLQKTYHKKIKMIYIDPPYNTGGDFVYKDNFRDNIKNYKQITGQLDGEGRNLSTNAETSGRYHTDWLNMIYPRLKLARNLLRDDGVIFISIDDNEQANLKKICDEIFGEEVCDTMIWRKSGVGRDGKMKNTTTFRKDHEYIFVCFKQNGLLNKSFEKPDWENEYGNPDDDPRGGYKAGSISKKEEASNPKHENYYSVSSPSGKLFTRQFDVSQQEFLKLDRDNRIYWGKDGDNVPAIKIFQNEKRLVTTSSIFIEKDGVINKSTVNDKNATTTLGSKELDKIMSINGLGKEVRPKPSYLIKRLTQIGSKADSTILDFFAGSGTTAHAVMQLNAEDGGNRRCISVQLPETTDEKSEAHKAGYATIAEITKERIRRAGKKIQEENPDYEGDLGFKVFKLDSSNIRPWDGDFDLSEADLIDMIDNIKHERTPDDVLYEILLKYGLDLTLPISEHIMEGQPVYNVGMGALIICLAPHITLPMVEQIAALKNELKPEIMRVVFKDAGFKDDVVKTNAMQILKQANIEDVRSL